MMSESQVNTRLEKETPDFSKYLVWAAMHKMIRKIEDGKIDSRKVSDLMWSLDMGMEEDMGGLQPIPSATWETMKNWNEALDMGFDEIIDEGLDYFARTYEYELKQISECE